MSVRQQMREQGMSYFGSLATFLAGWGVSDWLALFGFLTALITFGTGQYYQRQRHLRERALHEAQLEKEKLDIYLLKAREASLERRAPIDELSAAIEAAAAKGAP